MKLTYITKEQWLAMDRFQRVEIMAALVDEGREFELDVEQGGLLVEAVEEDE